MSEKQKLERVMFIGCLIIAGEAVFSLPFHVARFFRPTVLHVFEFTNTELGAVQAVYGVVAMLAYFPGGPLADRFPARRLLTGSLLSTSLGGFLLRDLSGLRRHVAAVRLLGLDHHSVVLGGPDSGDTRVGRS